MDVQKRYSYRVLRGAGLPPGVIAEVLRRLDDPRHGTRLAENLAAIVRVTSKDAALVVLRGVESAPFGIERVMRVVEATLGAPLWWPDRECGVGKSASAGRRMLRQVKGMALAIPAHLWRMS